ncbi:Ldh family oxidoreductase [Novosphingobium organovorum]|uniref:Ldh family oxidoreductase n=1 Tax=Novosphingobium organovorum TaxID=2930092 RepID=UPI002E0E8E49
MTMPATDNAETVHLTLEEADALARAVLEAAGLAPDHAAAVAATMVAGERDGCASHGLYRLLVAAASVEKGVAVPDAVPVVSEPARALVRVDGGGGFAQLPFERGKQRLVEKARAGGIAAMALTNVVHFAALWPEVEALANEGLVAFAFTPNHAWVAPAGGTQPVFGTNPIAFAWPRGGGREPFVFDFATSVIARGDIELHRRAGKPVPEDWGYDAQGQPTTEAAAVLEGAMRTFGGHKGSALAAMVELIAGPLIGEMTSAESLARDAGRKGSPIGGELIIAIDPAGFLGDQVEAHLDRAEAMFAAIEVQGARLPGTRRLLARRHSQAHGLTIARAFHAEIEELIQRGKDHDTTSHTVRPAGTVPDRNGAGGAAHDG